MPPSYTRVRVVVVWAYGRGQTDTQTRVIAIHFASPTTHAKCKEIDSYIAVAAAQYTVHSDACKHCHMPRLHDTTGCPTDCIVYTHVSPTWSWQCRRSDCRGRVIVNAAATGGHPVQCIPPPCHVEVGTVDSCTSTVADVHSGAVPREAQRSQGGGAKLQYS